MFSPEALEAALDPPEGAVDVTKIEFEVLDNGTPRWTLWNYERRLYSATLDRDELVAALQASAVLLRTMHHVFGDDHVRATS